MKYLSLLLVIAMAFYSCRKDAAHKTTSVFMNTATIRGPNLTVPACGAAFFITIHGIADSFAQFDSVPGSSSVDLATASFPINIKMNWHHGAGSECDTIANISVIDSMEVE